MKQTIRAIATHCMTFAGLLFFLWLLLILSAMIPNDAIRANMEQSGLYYEQVDDFQFHSADRWNAVADNYADEILLDVSWHIGAGNGKSVFVSAIDTDYYSSGESGTSAQLYRSVTEDTQPNTDYTRYWHGGVIFVRLLHLFTDVSGMKTLGFLSALAFAILTMMLLIQKKHSDFACLLALSLAAVQVWNIRLSLEYQTAFLVALVMCPLYLLLERRGDRYLTLLSVAGGVLIAFFDFLTAETLTILLPLIFVTAVRAKEGRMPPIKKSFGLILACGLCWGAAYAGTFLVKWAAASLITGENAFALALSSVAERMGGAETLGMDVSSGVLPAIAANLTMFFGGTARVQPVRVGMGVVISLGLLGSIWYLFRAKKSERNASVLLLLLGAVVFLRFLVLNNHSFVHEFFTYRALAASVLALLLALRLNIQLPQRKKVRR